MKKVIALGVVLLLGYQNLCAQTLTPEVTATAGGHFSSPAGSLTWTAGELMTGTYTQANGTLAQGFNQSIRPITPTTAASAITFSNVFTTQMRVSFTPGNGQKRLVVMRQALAVNWTPTNGLDYAANANFTLAQDQGSGNKVVMAANNAQVDVTGLIANTLYFVSVYEYNGSGSLTKYLATGAPTASQTTLAVPNVYVTTPANGAVNRPITLAVTAKLLAGATTYTIELNDAPDFTGNSFVMSGARTQNFTGLAYATLYYSRVKTNLSPDYGQVTTFSTLVPSTFVTTPANGAVNQNVTLNITATNLATASLWTIELNEAPDFSGAGFVQTGPRTQSFSGLSYNMTYYSRVKTDVYPFYGQVNTFATGTAESFSYVTAPANGATNVNLTVNVTSNIVIGAGNYTIELNTDPDFTGTSIVHSGPGRTYSFAGLLVNTTYYSRVMTDLAPNWGPSRSFTTTSALSLTYVTNPANNSINKLWHLNVTANLIPQATLYTIELNPDPLFLGAGITQSSSSNVINFAGLDFNTVYYNRVMTDLDPGWGVTRQFTTDHPSNYSFMTAPANGATNVKYVTNITANNVLDATTYTLEANTLPGFDGTSIIKVGARTQSFSLSYDQVYYVRVYTNLAPGIWGATRSFTTGNPVSLAYVTSPVDGAGGVPTTVNVTSNSVPGATSYTIELNTSILFDGISVVKTGAGRTKNFAGLAESTTYYSRVLTNLSLGVWGPTRSFTTINPMARASGDWAGDDTGDAAEEEIAKQPFDLLVYSNPFKGKLTFLIRTFDQMEAAVTLHDLTGRIIHDSRERTNAIIDIEKSMASGIYLLKVNAGGESKVVRVVKLD